MEISINKDQFGAVQSALLHAVELEFLPETIETMQGLLDNQFKPKVMMLRVIR